MLQVRRLVQSHCSASYVLLSLQDSNNLLRLQDAISIEIHCLEESHKHCVWDVHSVPLAVGVFVLEIINEFSESFEVNLALGHCEVDELGSSFEEVLEGAVLFNAAGFPPLMLELAEVRKVLINEMEWEVVNIKTLREVIAANMIFLGLIELVEFEVPEQFLEGVPEFEVLTASNLLPSIENSEAHQLVGVLEICLLSFQQVKLFAELSLLPVSREVF